MLIQKEGQFPVYQERETFNSPSAKSPVPKVRNCEWQSFFLLSKVMQILDRHLHVINIRHVKNHSLSTVSSHSEEKSSIF